MIEPSGMDKMNADLAAIAKRLNGVAKETPDKIKRRLTVGANTIRNTIIKSMAREKKSGKFYRRGGKTHRASAPGEAPAVDSGELLRAIVFDVRGMEVEIGAEAGAPYAELLEEGTSKMEARPWLEPAVEKHGGVIVNAVGKTVSKAIEEAIGGTK